MRQDKRVSHIRNRIFSVFFSALGFYVASGGPTVLSETSPSGTQEEIRQIERRLSQEKKELSKVGSQERDLLADLGRLEKEVEEKKREIEDLQRRIREANVNHNEMKRNLTQRKQQLAESREQVSRKLVGFYKRLRTGYLNAFADVADIPEFQRRLKYVRLILAQDKASLIRGAEKAKILEENIAKTEGRMKELRETTRNEESRLASLNKELEGKVLLLVKINQEKKFYETSIKELESAAEGLRQTLLEIEKKDPQLKDHTCHFADVRGKLPYPMKGKVLKGQALHPAWDAARTSKGIVIEGPEHSEVRAVFSGRVAFSGQLKGYGDLVIIHHGSRFFTVSANLAERTRVKGDRVREGEVIGRVGADGTARRGRLYFEIREGDKGLNPQEWLKPQ